MNSNLTAAQRKFHNWCRESGCIITGEPNPAIHHIKGAKMKLKGVKSPGEWYVLPLSYWWHQDPKNKSARHESKMMFQESTGKTEKEWWIELMKKYASEFELLPISDYEYNTIIARA